MPQFDLETIDWQEIDAQERSDASDITSLVEDANDWRNKLYSADGYVLYRDGEPVYSRGAEGGLYWQLRKDFAEEEEPPKKSDLFRRVAEHLNIAFAKAIKQGKHRLGDDEVDQIKEWLDGCQITFLRTEDGNGQGLADRLARVRLLPLQADRFSQETRDRIAAERAEEIDRQEYKRKRKWIDWAAITVGIVLSAIIGARLMYPLRFTDAAYSYPWLGGQSVFQFILGLFIAPWVVIPLYAWSVESKEWPLSRTTPLIALGLPLALVLAWFVLLKPGHDRQRDSFDAFNRYYHRIPDSKLSEPYYVDENSINTALSTVCADVGRQDGTDYICADLNLEKPKDRQVIGTFQTRTIHVVNEDDDGYSGSEHIVIYDAHDCSGLSTECDQ